MYLNISGSPESHRLKWYWTLVQRFHLQHWYNFVGDKPQTWSSIHLCSWPQFQVFSNYPYLKTGEITSWKGWSGSQDIPLKTASAADMALSLNMCAKGYIYSLLEFNMKHSTFLWIWREPKVNACEKINIYKCHAESAISL